MIILLTSKCTMNCRHCYDVIYRGKPELGKEDLLRILREASELGTLHVNFSGGEPLLRKDLLLLLREALELGISTSIVTNGSVLGLEMAKALSRLGVFVFLSVDGLKEEHEEIRGEGSWRYVEKSLDILSRAGNEFSLITSLNDRNLNQLEELVKLGVEKGSSFHSFIPVMKVGNAERNRVWLSKEGMKKFLTEVEKLSELTEVSLWCMPFAYRFVRHPRIHIGSCRRADVMDISVDGDVLLCDILGTPVSQVRTKSLKEAWEEQEGHPLTRKVANPDLRGPCEKCDVKDLCLGGCYSRSLIELGTLDGPDPLCPAQIT